MSNKITFFNPDTTKSELTQNVKKQINNTENGTSFAHISASAQPTKIQGSFKYLKESDPHSRESIIQQRSLATKLAQIFNRISHNQNSSLADTESTPKLENLIKSGPLTLRTLQENLHSSSPELDYSSPNNLLKSFNIPADSQTELYNITNSNLTDHINKLTKSKNFDPMHAVINGDVQTSLNNISALENKLWDKILDDPKLIELAGNIIDSVIAETKKDNELAKTELNKKQKLANNNQQINKADKLQVELKNEVHFSYPAAQNSDKRDFVSLTNSSELLNVDQLFYILANQEISSITSFNETPDCTLDDYLAKQQKKIARIILQKSLKELKSTNSSQSNSDAMSTKNILLKSLNSLSTINKNNTTIKAELNQIKDLPQTLLNIASIAELGYATNPEVNNQHYKNADYINLQKAFGATYMKASIEENKSNAYNDKNTEGSQMTLKQADELHQSIQQALKQKDHPLNLDQNPIKALILNLENLPETFKFNLKSLKSLSANFQTDLKTNNNLSQSKLYGQLINKDQLKNTTVQLLQHVHKGVNQGLLFSEVSAHSEANGASDKSTSKSINNLNSKADKTYLKSDYQVKIPYKQSRAKFNLKDIQQKFTELTKEMFDIDSNDSSLKKALELKNILNNLNEADFRLDQLKILDEAKLCANYIFKANLNQITNKNLKVFDEKQSNSLTQEQQSILNFLKDDFLSSHTLENLKDMTLTQLLDTFDKQFLAADLQKFIKNYNIKDQNDIELNLAIFISKLKTGHAKNELLKIVNTDKNKESHQVNSFDQFTNNLSKLLQGLALTENIISSDKIINKTEKMLIVDQLFNYNYELYGHENVFGYTEQTFNFNGIEHKYNSLIHDLLMNEEDEVHHIVNEAFVPQATNLKENDQDYDVFKLSINNIKSKFKENLEPSISINLNNILDTVDKHFTQFPPYLANFEPNINVIEDAAKPTENSTFKTKLDILDDINNIKQVHSRLLKTADRPENSLFDAEKYVKLSKDFLKKRPDYESTRRFLKSVHSTVGEALKRSAINLNDYQKIQGLITDISKMKFNSSTATNLKNEAKESAINTEQVYHRIYFDAANENFEPVKPFSKMNFEEKQNFLVAAKKMENLDIKQFIANYASKIENIDSLHYKNSSGTVTNKDLNNGKKDFLKFKQRLLTLDYYNMYHRVLKQFSSAININSKIKQILGEKIVNYFTPIEPIVSDRKKAKQQLNSFNTDLSFVTENDSSNTKKVKVKELAKIGADITRSMENKNLNAEEISQLTVRTIQNFTKPLLKH
jgi:hypothetical protein